VDFVGFVELCFVRFEGCCEEEWDLLQRLVLRASFRGSGLSLWVLDKSSRLGI
jgi:hypothetical protein